MTAIPDQNPKPNGLINPEKPKAQQSTQTETIFRYLLLAVLFISSICISEFLKFRVFCSEHGIYSVDPESLKWFVFGFIGVFAFKYSFKWAVDPIVEKLIAERYTGIERDHKKLNISKLSYDAIYCTAITVSAYIFFRETYWFPVELGGHGDCSQMYRGYPEWPIEHRSLMEIYLMIQLGSNVFATVEMPLFRKNERKFYENILHHSIAAFLILFSMMCNEVPAGIVTLILHDISNIIIAICRIYYDCNFLRSVAVQTILAISMVLSWFYTRVFLFPVCVLKNLYENRPNPDQLWFVIYWPYMYLLGICIVLYLMHLYWSYYIIKSLTKSIKNREFTNAHPDLKKN